MKLSTNDKAEVFIHSYFYINDGIRDRIDKLINDYKEKRFGLRFFVNVEFENFLMDMTWWQEQLLIHLSFARQNQIEESHSVISGALFWLNRLKDIELKSIIFAIRLKECYFGYSKAAKDKMNNELSRIAAEVMQEILAEEKLNNK